MVFNIYVCFWHMYATGIFSYYLNFNNYQDGPYISVLELGSKKDRIQREYVTLSVNLKLIGYAIF